MYEAFEYTYGLEMEHADAGVGVCVLKFGLPKSSYATCALRELSKRGASQRTPEPLSY